MSAENKKVEKAEEKPVRWFLVKCQVEDLNGEKSDIFTDVAPGDDEQDAKDFVTGWLAERGFVVKQWYSVGDAENILRAVEIITGRARKQ